MAAGDVLVDVADVSLTLGGNLILDSVRFQILDRERPGTVTGQIAALLRSAAVDCGVARLGSATRRTFTPPSSPEDSASAWRSRSR